MGIVTLELPEQQVIELTRHMSVDAKRILLKELLQEFELTEQYPPLTDEDLALIAESLFLELDQEESQHG
jgi:hypothetical protein